MRGLSFTLVAAALVFTLGVAAKSVSADGRLPPEPMTVPWPAANPVESEALARLHADNERLRRVVTYERRRLVQLKRVLLHSPTVTEALNLACTVYGNCATLWRRARCESHLFRYAQNHGSGAAGLLQFLGSTWRSTPFAGFSVFSAYANALAAGWMISVGRGSEWQCR